HDAVPVDVCLEQVVGGEGDLVEVRGAPAVVDEPRAALVLAEEVRFETSRFDGPRRTELYDLLRVVSDLDDHVVALGVRDAVELRDPREEPRAELGREPVTRDQERARLERTAELRDRLLPAERRDLPAQSDEVLVAVPLEVPLDEPAHLRGGQVASARK